MYISFRNNLDHDILKRMCDYSQLIAKMYGIDTIRKLNETAALGPAAAQSTTTTTTFTSGFAERQQNRNHEIETSLPDEVKSLPVKEVSLEAWDAEVLAAPLPVVVDFYATWCGPCDHVAPILGHLASELDGLAKFVKIDVDKSLEIADGCSVRSIPTIIIFKSGKELARTIGAQSKENLTKFVTTHISVETR
jgi:thioredoxin 1